MSEGWEGSTNQSLLTAAVSSVHAEDWLPTPCLRRASMARLCSSSIVTSSGVPQAPTERDTATAEAISREKRIAQQQDSIRRGGQGARDRDVQKKKKRPRETFCDMERISVL